MDNIYLIYIVMLFSVKYAKKSTKLSSFFLAIEMETSVNTKKRRDCNKMGCSPRNSHIIKTGVPRARPYQ